MTGKIVRDGKTLRAVRRGLPADGPADGHGRRPLPGRVPGSHRRLAGKPDPGGAIPAEMPAGSVLLFSGRLYHGAGANTTARPRLGVVIDYVQPWLRPCEDHTLSADQAEVRLLPRRLQELLGFNQPSPYLGFINGKHPRDWLMSNQGQSSQVTVHA